MILTQLQPYKYQSPKRIVRRSIVKPALRGMKLLSRKVRRTRSQIKSYARRQYFPTDAIVDIRKATAHNEDIFIGTLLVAAIIGFSYAVIAMDLGLQFLVASTELSAVSGVSALFLYIVGGAVFSVVSFWIASLLANMTGIALMEGANRKYYRSLISTVRRSLHYASKVTGIWVTFLALLFGPVAAAAIGGYIYLQSSGVSIESVIPWAVGGTVIAVAWVIGIALNYSLAPYVSLFEPTLSIRQAFRRSHNLVRFRGRLFILGGYVLLGLALTAAQYLSILMRPVTFINGDLLVGLSVVAILLISNSMMVMFYRKRRMARR